MTLANQDNSLIIESLMKIIERYSSDETNVIKSIKPDFINKIEKLLTQKKYHTGYLRRIGIREVNIC